MSVALIGHPPCRSPLCRASGSYVCATGMSHGSPLAAVKTQPRLFAQRTLDGIVGIDAARAALSLRLMVDELPSWPREVEDHLPVVCREIVVKMAEIGRCRAFVVTHWMLPRIAPVVPALLILLRANCRRPATERCGTASRNAVQPVYRNCTDGAGAPASCATARLRP